MNYILLIIAAISVITIFISCTATNKKPIETSIQINSVSQDVPDATGLSRDGIKTLLQKLADDPPPVNLMTGAMCYKTAGPSNRMEYICPVCGKKTLYAHNDSKVTRERMVGWDVISDLSINIHSCRRLIDNITKIHARLDESQFCSHCGPDTDNPRLGLIIFYPDSDKPYSVYSITADDFILIIEFLAGKTKHAYPDNREIPLKNQIKRLETLLGVSLNKV